MISARRLRDSALASGLAIVLAVASIGGTAQPALAQAAAPAAAPAAAEGKAPSPDTVLAAQPGLTVLESEVMGLWRDGARSGKRTTLSSKLGQ